MGRYKPLTGRLRGSTNREDNLLVRLDPLFVALAKKPALRVLPFRYPRCEHTDERRDVLAGGREIYLGDPGQLVEQPTHLVEVVEDVGLFLRGARILRPLGEILPTFFQTCSSRFVVLLGLTSAGSSYEDSPFGRSSTTAGSSPVR